MTEQKIKRVAIHIELSHLLQKAKLEKGGKFYLPLANEDSKGSKKNGSKLEVCKVKLKVNPLKVKPRDEGQLRDACLALCSFPDCIENAESAATVFLLTLLSQIAHLSVGITPALPAVILDCDAPAATLPIQTLLQAIQGPKQWRGKGWKLRRPYVVKPHLAMGETAPSVSLYDYIGGKFYDDAGKRRRFCFPIISSTIALMPNVPPPVVKGVAQASPLALLLVFNDGREVGSRAKLKIKGAGFDSYDIDKLDQLNDLALLCYGEITAFLNWFCQKKKHVRRWRSELALFRPVTRQGHFCKPQSDDRTEWLCAGLSLLRQFLLFASGKAGWITVEEADGILIKYWRLVLPASAPPTSAPDKRGDIFAQVVLAYDAPQVFYRFLTDIYLPTYHKQIVVGARGEPGTMGLIHMLDGKQYFIAPRRSFLEVYDKWLTGQGAIGFDLSSTKAEANIQRKLREAGVPVYSEKNNPSTWRFQFHKENGPKGKISCLALPLAQLPASVQTVFVMQFGVDLPQVGPTNHSDAATNNEEGVNLL